MSSWETSISTWFSIYKGLWSHKIKRSSWIADKALWIVSRNRNRTPSEWQSRQTWSGRRQRNVAKAWKRRVFGLHAGQCVCGLKMNKLIGRTSHGLCTFSTSIREISEIKYYFNIWGIRKKKKRKKGAQKKGGENSPISPPLDPRLQTQHSLYMATREFVFVIVLC